MGELETGGIRACYSTAAVSGTRSDSSLFVGGLVGEMNDDLFSSYATGPVSASDGRAVGGLVGEITSNWPRDPQVVNSYATGAVTGSGGSLNRGGLVGGSSSSVPVRASYSDRQTTGQGSVVNYPYHPNIANLQGGTSAQTTSDLQAPTGYTGLYEAWDNIDTNGDGRVDAADDAWDFGTGHQYPVLKYDGMDTASQYTDYDADDDGLIDVATLAQLNAVRWDLDGDGAPAPGATSTAVYYGATSTATYYDRGFNHALLTADGTGLACPTTGGDADDNDCLGYELLDDLDFDTNGSGNVDASDAHSSWTPIGGSYSAVFDGNNRTISNLTVDAAGHAGLFHTIAAGGTVRGVGLADVDARLTIASGTGYFGALASRVDGAVLASWSSGRFVGAGGGSARFGGLAGHLGGRIAGSYSSATGVGAMVGGLAAHSGGGTIVASYATGRVAANQASGAAGGLVGVNDGALTVRASYYAGFATSTVSSANVGGLVGQDSGTLTLRDAYFSSDTTGLSGAGARTTAALETPTAATGIYANWDNLDVDGDGGAGENPWHFGGVYDLPVLDYGGLATSTQVAAQPSVAVSLIASPRSVSVTEGATSTYTVALSVMARETVTVTASSDHSAVEVDTDAGTSGLQSTLTFTPQNWNTPQTVTVRGVVDADAVDEFATVANAADATYGAANVIVGVLDAQAKTGTDYDVDNDRLIDIDTVTKLNALRWDLNGDGMPASSSSSSYANVFGSPAANMGCPDGPDNDALGECVGYELTADLNFDTNGDGSVNVSDTISNWPPIADWAGVFDGGGRVIRNLTVTRTDDDVGMFSSTTAESTIRSLGLVDVSVTTTGVRAGALASVARGRVAAVYSTGSVTAAGGVGGLVAEAHAPSEIVASYSRVAVRCTTNANLGADGRAREPH